MLDLLDVFVEADRLANFTKYFTHSGTKEVRSRDQLRPLIILDLFAEGANTGARRVSCANHQYTYDELLYVRKNYFSIDALRNANGAVVNKILALRNPRLWGEGQACASDGKRVESWSQNLMTEWRVEKNFVDSHGQSEVAFAFCPLLGGIRLMPRLKRLKYERLYLLDGGMSADFPNLARVLTRPIRWHLIKQYAVEAGIEKRVYPHLFRHQIITYLTKKGISSPKL
jgi:hypothetical protein